MSPRDGLVPLALLCSLLLAGCAGPQEGTVRLTEDFEKGIRNWDKGSDVPEDPNRPGENVSWSIEPSREQAVSGDFSANYTLDGSQDDGTIWLVQGLQVDEEQAYRATMSVQAWSASESFNTLAYLVMFLGPEPPGVEEDFPAPGENTTHESQAPRGGLREELNKQEGWREYSFGWNVSAEQDQLWAAVGISAVWETEMTYFVDDVEIELEPVEDAGPG